MLFSPHGRFFVEPDKGVGRAERTAAHVADGQVRAIHQLAVAKGAQDRLVGNWLAVGAGVKVQIVEVGQRGQAFHIVGRLKAARRMG